MFKAVIANTSCGHTSVVNSKLNLREVETPGFAALLLKVVMPVKF